MSTPAPKPYISAIAPYVAGRATTTDGRRVVKLSANENPLGTSAEARSAFAAAAASLDRYPDPGATALREAIGQRFGLDPARIIYGTGSDDLLHLVAGAFAGVGDEVMFMRYGFTVYPIAARRVGADPVEVPDNEYGTDVDGLLAHVSPRTRLVYVANPNNPTGTYCSRAELARLHAGLPSDCLLVVDQAYTEYLEPEDDDGALVLAQSAANVLVVRTFSKIHGLAAERIGWGYGPAAVIDAMHRIRAPFNVSAAGQAAAIGALDADAFIADSYHHNLRWRSWFAGELERFAEAGLRVVPSKANFLLVLFEGRLTAERAYGGLMDAGYITRWLPGQGLAHALRITIGTEEQMRAVVAALDVLVRDAG